MVEGPGSTRWGNRGRTRDQKIAASPSSQFISWQGYSINGYLFYTATKDKKTVSYNSGVRIKALDERKG
jgi:hypothetical protein